MGIKRYGWTTDYSGGVGIPVMGELTEGEFVLYTDHVAAMEQPVKAHFGARGGGKAYDVQAEQKGDIVGWLRRREDWPVVCMGGKLAGEIADYIERLQQEQNSDKSDWCKQAGCSHKNAGSPVWETKPAQQDADKGDAQMKQDYCREKLKPGGCQVHNVHCGYPACNEPPDAFSQPAGRMRSDIRPKRRNEKLGG